MTNGQPLRVRAAMKPISTVPRALATVDLATGEQAVAIHQRSDVCAVPAAGVVVEAMVALVLARAALEKFGGDSLAETRRNIDGYLRAIAEREAVDGSASVGCRGSGDGAEGRADRAARLGEIHHRAAARQSHGAERCSTPTPRSRNAPAARIAEIFAADGEAGFRRIEEEVIREALADPRRHPLAGRRRGDHPRCARRAGRPHRGLPGDQRGRGHAPHQWQHRAPVARRTRPGREVPRADERAGSAVPPGGDHPDQHQPAQPRGGGALYRLAAWRIRSRRAGGARRGAGPSDRRRPARRSPDTAAAGTGHRAARRRPDPGHPGHPGARRAGVRK